MEQHPIPRQITTFEFKLIGFLTLKQFIYLIVFAPLGFIVYKIFPIPLLNIVFGGATASIGLAFAFVPINDRPLDVWIKNLARRAVSPTQYLYQKQNPPIYFLQDLVFVSDPHHILSHVESQQKLASYLAKKTPADQADKTKQAVGQLFEQPNNQTDQNIKTAANNTEKKPEEPDNKLSQQIQPQKTDESNNQKAPFLTGVIKNHRLIPLPGILIYVKDQDDKVVRLLKTNPHGVFATFKPLPEGNYVFDPKDPRNTYFFDTMKVDIDKTTGKPLEIFSKELL